MTAFWRPDPSSDGLIDESPLAAYWRAYGGLRAVLNSNYFWIALTLTAALMPLWCSGQATPIALATLPNLLGFSIGGVAIVLAFPSGRLMKIVTEGGQGTSFYMDLASRLVHFIVVQVVAILMALFASAYANTFTNGLSCLLFIYGLMTGVAAGLSLFGIAKIYNAIGGSDDGDEARK